MFRFGSCPVGPSVPPGARALATASLLAACLGGCASTYVGRVPKAKATDAEDARREVESFSMHVGPLLPDITLGRKEYDSRSVEYVMESVSPEARSRFGIGNTIVGVGNALASVSLGMVGASQDFDLTKFDGTSRTQRFAVGLLATAVITQIVGQVFRLQAVASYNSALQKRFAPFFIPATAVKPTADAAPASGEVLASGQWAGGLGVTFAKW